MFGHRYFGARYYGPRYWGDGGDVVVPPVVATPPRGADAWPDELRKRVKPRPKRDRTQDELDKVELRAMLEDAFDGPRPEAVRELLVEFRLPKGAPRQAYSVDWDAMLADLAACRRALEAHQARLAVSRARDAAERSARVREMVEMIDSARRREKRKRLLPHVARLMLIEDD